jgi:hypothetical protein
VEEEQVLSPPSLGCSTPDSAAELVWNDDLAAAVAGGNQQTGRYGRANIGVVLDIDVGLGMQTCPYPRKVLGLGNQSPIGRDPSFPWWDIAPNVALDAPSQTPTVGERRRLPLAPSAHNAAPNQ